MKALTPPKLDEIVGRRDILQKVEDAVRIKRPALLTGPPGVGKTRSVYAVAEKLSYEVVEINASDERKREQMERLSKVVAMKTIRPTIYLVDEADGIEDQSRLNKVIQNAKNPLVLTANEPWRISRSIRGLIEEIAFTQPKLEDVIGRISVLADKQKINYQNTSGDVRNSLIGAFYGSEGYERSDKFRMVEKTFTGRGAEMGSELLIWLLDNAPRFYEGGELYEFYQLLSLADFLGRPELIKFLKPTRARKASYPYYLRRVKTFGRIHK